MKHKLLLILLLSVTSNLFAQRDYTINVTDTITDYCSFNSVEVLDYRVNKENFGYIKTGPLNVKTALLPKYGAAQMIRHFVEQTIKPAKNKQPNTLLILLRNFKITDRQVAGEIGTFHIRMSLYLGKDDKYNRILNLDTFMQVSNGWDVTKGLLQLADQQMSHFIKYAASVQNIIYDNQSFSKAAILQQIDTEHHQYKIYSEPPHYGVYYTEAQFLNNVPADTAFTERFTDPSIDNSFVFNLKKENGKRGESLRNIDFFALYDGKRWFKKTAEGIIKMQFIQNDFYYSQTGKGIRANENLAMAFGIIGALLTNNGASGKALYNLRYNPEGGDDHIVERLK